MNMNTTLMESIVKVLKENAGTFFSAEELAAKVQTSKRTIWNYMSRALKDGTRPTNIHSLAGKGYCWIPTEKNNSKADDVMTNPEGYSDSTAGKAIKNLTKYSFNDAEREPGTIWSAETVHGESRLYLVLSEFPGTVNCLVVSLIDNWYDEDTCIMVYRSKSGLEYYVDPRHIVSVPTKRFVNKKAAVPKEKFENEIKAAVAECIGITYAPVVIEKEVPVEVEKIVEKEVPVEVEKIVEKEVPVETDTAVFQEYMHQLELAEQRADIWEKAFRAVTTMGSD